MQQELAGSQASYKPDAMNFGIKLKDTNASAAALYSEQHQRKLEMLESRFVPLNPQKVINFLRKIFNFFLFILLILLFTIVEECVARFFQSECHVRRAKSRPALVHRTRESPESALTALWFVNFKLFLFK